MARKSAFDYDIVSAMPQTQSTHAESHPTPPLISVIIPVYNREDMIGEAVSSALDQTYGNTQVVVVDDASDDGTHKRLMAFGDAITLIRHRKNRGQSAARNTGIEGCAGRYVLFLDSDDTLEPDGLGILFDALASLAEKDGSWGCVYGRRLTCDASLQPVRVKYPDHPSGWILKDLFYMNHVRTGTYLVRRSILKDVGGFREDLVAKEDLLLQLCIAHRYRFAFVDRFISRYRRHGGVRARNDQRGILLQGTRHLDYYFDTHGTSAENAPVPNSDIYAKEHLSLAKLAWRCHLPEDYLTHWRAACSLRARTRFYPKYLFRAMISALKRPSAP